MIDTRIMWSITHSSNSNWCMLKILIFTCLRIQCCLSRPLNLIYYSEDFEDRLKGSFGCYMIIRMISASHLKDTGKIKDLCCIVLKLLIRSWIKTNLFWCFVIKTDSLLSLLKKKKKSIVSKEIVSIKYSIKVLFSISEYEKNFHTFKCQLHVTINVHL